MATSLNPTFVQQISSVVKDQIRNLNNNKLARVTHVVYGPYYFGTNIPDPYYNDPTSIGLITYQYLDSNENRTSNSSGNPPAKPLNSNIKKFPTNGEVVSILTGPSLQMNEDKEAPDFYYTQPFNIWNAVHHNSFPDLGDYQQFTTNTKKNYEVNQATNQANNVSFTGSVNFPLGPKFPEKQDVKDLRIFPGDITIESRWGSSIRFGSTTPEGQADNPWSRNSQSIPGNPITIIRNGQGRQLDTEGWIPTIENINRDPSSIYLTNGQEITIADIQNNFSLASLQVSLQTVVANSIPLQQSLTSIESISALDQDKNVVQSV